MFLQKVIDMHYEWFRAGHIICVIAWMAGMLMLPRLLVYRIEGRQNLELVAMMDSAIIRLRKIILTPMMILTWVFGFTMAHFQWHSFQHQPWFWIKIFCVVLISAAHGYFIGLHKQEIAGGLNISSKTLRLLNEIPFLLAIVAVIMVVVEPFSR